MLTLDPLASMAESEAERIEALLMTVRTDSAGVQELLRRIAGPGFGKSYIPNETGFDERPYTDEDDPPMNVRRVRKSRRFRDGCW